MKLYPHLSKPSLVLQPEYYENGTWRDALARKGYEGQRRWLLLDAMRKMAERQEPYLIDASMTLSDETWRCYAELILDDAVFETVAADGSTCLVITRRGLDLLHAMDRQR
jgi:hypothetical protein